MKKLTFASVGLIAVAAALRTAAAADADVYGPPPVVYPPVTVVIFTWTGFYFGGTWAAAGAARTRRAPLMASSMSANFMSVTVCPSLPASTEIPTMKGSSVHHSLCLADDVC